MRYAEAKPGQVVRVTVPDLRYYRYSTLLRGCLVFATPGYSGTVPGGSSSMSPDDQVELVSPPEASAFKQSLFIHRGAPLCRNQIVFGSDPEVFVTVDGTLLPAWQFLPKKGGGKPPQVFWDGFQAEFTTNPSACISFCVDNIRDGLYQVLAVAQRVEPEAQLTPACVFNVPQALMLAANDEQAALGCAPSVNAYPDVRPLAVPDSRDLPLRFAGCHIHIGSGPLEHEYVADNIVPALDNLVGVVSVALLAGCEDVRRRKFYGLAGEFRRPAHGVEYRVLSSTILAHPVLVHLILDLMRIAYHAGCRGDRLLDVPSDEARRIINTLDVAAAREVLEGNHNVLMAVLTKAYQMPASVEKARRLIMEGASQCLNMGNMAKAWRLTRQAWAAHSNSPGCNMESVRLRRGASERHTKTL